MAAIIERADLQQPAPAAGGPSGIIPINYATEIITAAAETSVALRTFRSVRMPTGVTSMPVVQALPSAEWVLQTPLTGAGNALTRKPATEPQWQNLVLTAEELACVVVIPEAVLEDASINLWNEIKPMVAEAIGQKIDLTVFFGATDVAAAPAVQPSKPPSFPPGLHPQAETAGQAHAVVDPDFLAALLAAFDDVEGSGFDVTTVYGGRGLRGLLRGLVDSTGRPLYLTDFKGTERYETILGANLELVGFRGWMSDESLAIVGDPNYAIIGMRHDGIQYRILDQASIDVSAARDGSEIVNLAQQDSVALRCRFRMGFVVANPPTGATPAGFPFATVTPDVTP